MGHFHGDLKQDVYEALMALGLRKSLWRWTPSCTEAGKALMNHKAAFIQVSLEQPVNKSGAPGLQTKQAFIPDPRQGQV